MQKPAVNSPRRGFARRPSLRFAERGLKPPPSLRSIEGSGVSPIAGLQIITEQNFTQFKQDIKSL